MYKVCKSCHKGNKLMVADLHEECMLCLGTEHLVQMKCCQLCQALGYEDRLEHARRFAYQRSTGKFISAREMRSFVARAETLPPSLEKAKLEPYFIAPDWGRDTGTP